MFFKQFLVAEKTFKLILKLGNTVGDCRHVAGVMYCFAGSLVRFVEFGKFDTVKYFVCFASFVVNACVHFACVHAAMLLVSEETKRSER